MRPPRSTARPYRWIVSGSDRAPDDISASGDDLYGTLGVGANASAEDLSSAYRRLARQHHPDSNPNALSGDFSAVSDAYEVLRDPERRRSYDATRQHRRLAADAASGIRIPVHRHGMAGAARAGRLPEQIELPLTFEQAALGTTVTAEIPVPARCRPCEGSGHTTPGTCGACAGAGHTVRQSGGINIRRTCDSCAGRGTTPPRACSHCAGDGHVIESRDVKVRVPAGTDDGTVLRFTAPGDHEVRAVARVGDHAYFGRQGRDLTLRLPITVSEAALGAVVTVPTLGGAVAMRIPPGTPTGRTFRVRGRGVHHPDQPGDLLVTAEVLIPAALTDAQRAALEALDAATPSPRVHLEGRSPLGARPEEDRAKARD